MASQEIRQSHGAEPGFYGYIIVIVASFIMMVVFGVYDTFGIFFKPVLADFGWTRALISGAYSVSWIVHGFLVIIMGGLTDRLGPRVVLTSCGVFLGIGFLFMSQIVALWQFYLFYGVLIGTGLSGVFVPLASTVARWFVERRTIMTGIVAAGSGIGQLIAPPVANWLISIYDWRVSYIIFGSIVLVAVIFSAQFLKRDPTQLGQIPYGENKMEEHGLKVRTEGFPLSKAARTRQFWLVFALFFCFGFSLHTIIVHIVPHTTDLGVSPASAANILATVGGLSIVGMVVLGSAGDRIGNRQGFIIGFILMSAALLWLVPATEIWMLYLFAAVYGFAYGGCIASQSPLVAELFGLRSHGLIFGITSFGFTSSAVIGPLLAGYIFDITGSYQVAFLVCAAIGVVGLVLTVLLKSIKGKHGQNGLPSTI